MVRPTGVYLLNPSFTILNFIDPERAIALVATDRAWIFLSVPGQFVRSPNKNFAFPTHIVLNKWTNVPYFAPKTHEIFATRMGVLRRDGWTCGYCGDPGATIDHVFPESKGGEDTWANLITACQPCNAKKANRTPEEAGMKLLWYPKAPTQKVNHDKEQKRIWDLIGDQNADLTSGLDTEYDEEE